MGLADLLGIADLHCRKVESTKWFKHKLRATIGGQQFEQTNGRSGFPFPLRSVGGWLEFVARILGDSSKLSSSGLAISMTNLMFRICSFIQQNISTIQPKGLFQYYLYQIQCSDRGWSTLLKGVWPSFLVWSPPWLYASSVKTKTNNFASLFSF